MTLNQKRRAVYVVFLLPVILLGLASLGVGAVRLWTELGGVETPADTVSGIGMLGLSLIPLGFAGLLLFIVLRSPYPLPPPAAAQLAPGTPTRAGRYDFDRVRLDQSLQPLGIDVERPAADTILSLSSRDRWSFGLLFVTIAAGLALFVGWPSFEAGRLMLGPADGVLVAFYLWFSLFCLLAAMPLSPRRVLVQPSFDALHLDIGRRRRTFGLSRLAGLEARVQVSTRRDGETRAANSRSFRSQLVAWFRAERRGPVAFVLLWSPSAAKYEESREHLALMETAAAELARGLGVPFGPPELPGDQGPAPDAEPYE